MRDTLAPWWSVLSIALGCVGPSSRIDPAALVSEAERFSAHDVYGDRYAFAWTSELWGRPEDLDGGLDPTRGAERLSSLVAGAPSLTLDVDEVCERFDAVVQRLPPDHGWWHERDERVVQRFEDRVRNTYPQERSADAIYSYSDSRVSLVGGPSLDTLEVRSTREAAGVLAMGDLLEPFSESGIDGWAQGGDWDSAAANVRGRERVRLATRNGYLGDPEGQQVVLFERRNGALLPVAEYQSDELMRILTLFRYTDMAGQSGGPGTAGAPFPREVCRIISFEHATLSLRRSSIEHLDAPTSADELRVPIKRGAALTFRHPTLDAAETAILHRTEPSTWPTRGGTEPAQSPPLARRAPATDPGR